MHQLMLKSVIDACRARIAEGDCPTTKAIPAEQLEEAIVQLAAPVPELTEGDRHVLIHALTGSGDGRVYRNYYNANDGHANMPSIRRLIAAGLMIVGSPGYFHCTEAGAKAVCLHLPNDSRDAAPVPADAAAIYAQCAKIAFDTPDKFGTLANDSHKECALVASRLINYAAKRAAPVPAREWIPVGKRLPDREDWVMTWDGMNIWPAVADPVSKSFDRSVPKFDDDNAHPVTHWMPLPPPPAADNTKGSE